MVISIFGKDGHKRVPGDLNGERRFPLPLMSLVLAPVIALYHYGLKPLPVFTWLGLPVSALDVAGALRLALASRQHRELYYEQHIAKVANHKGRSGGKATGKTLRGAADETIEPRSRVRDFVATLVTVHGGEAIVGASRCVLSCSPVELTRVSFPDALSITFSRSTVAWLATCVLHFEHFLHIFLRRTGARRPLASVTEPIPIHRSFADRSPCVLPHDPIMQCNPESSRRTRLTCYSSLFIYPTVDRMGTCEHISPSAFANREFRSWQTGVPSSLIYSPLCVRRR